MESVVGKAKVQARVKVTRANGDVEEFDVDDVELIETEDPDGDRLH